MANPNPYGPPPWTDAEKNFLLAELIKQGGPQPLQLLQVLESMNTTHIISWNDIPLPTGRTLTEAMNAFSQLRRSAGLPQPTYIAPSGMGGQTPSPLSATAGSKRTWPFEAQGGRALRPKPSPTGNIYGLQFPQIEQPPKKKRGRPTKAEQAERQKAQAVTAESSATPLTAQGEAPYATTGAASAAAEPPDLGAAETSPAEPSPAEQPRPPLPTTVSRMPISSIITPAPKSASQSSSSSGKRRRGRSMRAGVEDIPTPSGSGGPVQPAAQEYESPYARVFPQAQSSPTITTTAAMRYRDDAMQPTAVQPEQQSSLPPPPRPPPMNQPQPQPPPPAPPSSSSPEHTRSS